MSFIRFPGNYLKVISESSKIQLSLTAKRDEAQEGILLAMGKALNEEAKHLSSRVAGLEKRIFGTLMEPSEKATQMQSKL